MYYDKELPVVVQRTGISLWTCWFGWKDPLSYTLSISTPDIVDRRISKIFFP